MASYTIERTYEYMTPELLQRKVDAFKTLFVDPRLHTGVRIYITGGWNMNSDNPTILYRMNEARIIGIGSKNVRIEYRDNLGAIRSMDVGLTPNNDGGFDQIIIETIDKDRKVR